MIFSAFCLKLTLSRQTSKLLNYLRNNSNQEKVKKDTLLIMRFIKKYMIL